MPTDVDLKQAILATLARDPRVRAQVEGRSIRFRSEGGTVWLEGEVETLGEKMLAASLVEELSGVEAVENRLRIRPVPLRTDLEILDHVMHGLTLDGYLDARTLTVKVEQAVVILTGTQDALAKKRLAGVIAWGGAGVVDVRNEIQVVPAEDDSDDEITDAVRIAFDRNKLINPLRYQVATRNEVVYLTGIAASAAERQIAENDAWSIWGVRDVVNQIALEA
jgi:osmotically-inducible protein OsmY